MLVSEKESIEVNRAEEDKDDVTLSEGTLAFLWKAHGHSKLTQNLALTYMGLSRMEPKKRDGWTQEEISKMSFLGITTTRSCLRILELHGVIKSRKRTQDGKNKATVYWLLDKKNTAVSGYKLDIKIDEEPAISEDLPSPHEPSPDEGGGGDTLAARVLAGRATSNKGKDSQNEGPESKDSTQSKPLPHPSEKSQNPLEGEGKKVLDERGKVIKFLDGEKFNFLKNSFEFKSWVTGYHRAVADTIGGIDNARAYDALLILQERKIPESSIEGAVANFFLKTSFVMNAPYLGCRTFHYFAMNIDKFLPAAKETGGKNYDSSAKERFYVLWDPRHPKYLVTRDNAEKQQAWERSMGKPWTPGPSFEEVHG
jgi:hypothetical protein